MRPSPEAPDIPVSIKVLIAFGLLTLFLGRLTNSNADPDLWGYLAFGRYFWETGFPYRDIFSYLPTKEVWIYHEWLTGVLFYPVMNAFGGTGLQLLKFFIGLLTVALIFLAARKRGASLPSVIIGLFLVSPLLSFAYSPVRAQIFTNLFFILSILLIEQTRKDARWLRLLWLLPIQVLWCNLHGGFLAGLGLLLLYAFGEMLSQRRFMPYIWIFLGCSLATIINPYGLDYWRYMHEAVSMARPEIMEWASLFQAIKGDVYTENVLAFLILFFLSLVFVGKWGRDDYPAIVVLMVTAYLGFSHVRHEAFFFLSFGAYVPFFFGRAWKELEKHPVMLQRWQRLSTKATPFIFAALIIIFIQPILFGKPLHLSIPSHQRSVTAGDNYPAGAIEFMRRNNLSGNILTEFDWGELMLWNFYPESRVGMDGRYETVYPKAVCDEFFSTFKGNKNWQGFLRKYPHTIVIIRSNSYLATLLRNQKDWHHAYQDESSTIFLRSMPPNKASLKDHPTGS